MLLCAMLAGCGQEEGKLAGVLFERGHGSAWGNQFYIEVTAEEISLLRYFPEGTGEQTQRQHIPITAEQWQQLEALLSDMELKEAGGWREKLFGGAKQDGGEYRRLTLLRETGKGRESTLYQWPQSRQAEALESLLEQLAEGTK